MKVAQSCPTLRNPRDYIVHAILQARILECVAFPISRGSSQPRDWTQVFCIVGGFFTSWATREAQEYWSGYSIPSPADLPDSGIALGSPTSQVDSLPTELSGSPCTWLLNPLYAEYIMRNAGLEEAQAGIKIAGRNINNLIYADDMQMIPPLWQKVKRN